MSASTNEEDMIRSKIVEYSGFINNVLLPEKKTLELEYQKIQTEINEYQDLQNEISNLLCNDNNRSSESTSDGDSSNNDIETKKIAAATTTSESVMTTKVDLGYETIYCDAVVSEPNSIYVHVGMGFHIELTLVEAIEFVKKRISYLQKGSLQTKKVKLQEVTSHIDESRKILFQLDRELQQMSR